MKIDKNIGRALLLSLLIFIMGNYVFYQSKNKFILEQQQVATRMAANTASTIEQQITMSLSATQALGALLKENGEIKNFNELAKEMIQIYDNISSLQLAPDGIVKQIYPLQGNEKALGLNNLRDPERQTESIQAINSGKVSLAGPVNLIQGGVGLIGRYPVFLDKGKIFWGFTVVILKLEDILRKTHLNKLKEAGYLYKLWRIDPTSGKKIVFSSNTGKEILKGVDFSFQIPNNRWVITMIPEKGWKYPIHMFWIHSGLFLLSLLVSSVFYLMLAKIKSNRENAYKFKENEEILNEAQSVAKMGSWTLNLQTGEFVISKNLYSIYGIDPSIAFPKITSFQKYVHPEDYKKIYEIVKSATINKKPYEYEVRIIRSDGEERFVHTRGHIEYDETGEPVRHYGTTQDITDRKISELKQKQAAEQLEDALATKDKFFSIIAHDLKNPFLSINGYANILYEEIEELDNDTTKEYLKYIVVGSKKVNNLLNSLLTWAKAQSGGLKSNPEQFSLNPVIEECLQLHLEIAAKKDIRLNFENKIPFDVFADKAMIQTVLRNLISNAVKFTNRSGQVDVNIEKIDDSTVRVNVKDTGIGMSSEEAEKVFKIEEKLSRTGTDNETGSGLGLILAKEFIEKNGGFISLKSEPDKGSSFSFTLPMI